MEKPQKFKRNYRACLNCRVRKVKCDLGPVDNPHDGKCARCLRERKDCVFVESKRGGSTNVLNGKRKKMRLDSELTSESQSPESFDRPNIPSISKDSFSQKLPGVNSLLNESESPRLPPITKSSPTDQFNTMEGALVFLASAAGTIAKVDERDNIDAQTKYNQIEEEAKKIQNYIPEYIKPTGERMTVPAAENGFAVRPKASSKLSNIEYIGVNGILTEEEAEKLVNLFFATMHPFFPHIPKFLHSSKVLAGYPILLCAILTISSRYHPFENNTSSNINGNVPRNIEVHDRLWLYVQRLISQTVWAEASTRSIGTIFAFLLFTEWNPRAIHWRWSDYANKAEEPNEESVPVVDYSVTSFTGLGAMRRSHRMAWMLIGSAVRLAQDMGFMEISSKVFLATHVAEINSVMDISRRSMLAHSLSEVDLDEDEISEEYMEEVEEEDDDDFKIMKMTEEDLKKIASEGNVKFTKAQKAQIELLQIMSLGHESLYGYKAQLGQLSQRQNLSVLSIISPLISNWGRKYKHLLVPKNNWKKMEASNSIERESFVFEYNYVKLYIYSLALSPSPKKINDKKVIDKKIALKLNEMSKSAKYIEQAFNAANEMLKTAHRIHKLKSLRFMPVRWLTRIVRAVAFIVKCYLTITAHKKTTNTTEENDYDPTILSLSMISIEDISQSIHRAALTLRDCSPDELHLCTRYSNVLMYLYSEMKTKKNAKDDYVPPEPPKEYNLTPDLENVNDNPLDMIGDSEVMEWFINNRTIGLDFVAPWTEMIEQQLNLNDQFTFDYSNK